MEQNLLKALALMQFNNEYFFVLDDIAYTGTKDAALESYEADKDTANASFEEWCIENVVRVEEYDEYTNNYLVLTNEEADQKWEEYLDDYLEQCIYPELPHSARGYFDDEKWKNDMRTDGRGHSLSSYDGNEEKETIEDETFYIYRIN